MDADKKSVEGGHKMKNFEVGERVQVIVGGKLIEAIYQGDCMDVFADYTRAKITIDNQLKVVTVDSIIKLDQPEPQSEKVKKINEIMLELINRKHMDILNDDDITRMLIEALDIVNTLDEPKPVVVPPKIFDFIQSYDNGKDSLIVFEDILNDYVNDEGIPSTYILEWLDENLFELADALRYGYVVEEAKNWIVSIKYHDGQYDVRYFHSFAGRTSKEDFPSVVSVKKRAYRFTEKEKAEAVAVLIDGTVEEVEAE